MTAAGSSSGPARRRPGRVRTVLAGVVACALVVGLLAMLAVAVTMLVRMLVEGETEPELHVPTLVVVSLALLPGLWWVLRSRPAGGRRRARAMPSSRARRLFDGTVVLAFSARDGAPTASFAYTGARSPGESGPVEATIPVGELTPRDLTLLQRTMDAAASDADDAGAERVALSLSRLDSLLTGSAALRSPLHDVLVRGEAAVAESEGGASAPEDVLAWADRPEPPGQAPPA